MGVARSLRFLQGAGAARVAEGTFPAPCSVPLGSGAHHTASVMNTREKTRSRTQFWMAPRFTAAITSAFFSIGSSRCHPERSVDFTK